MLGCLVALAVPGAAVATTVPRLPTAPGTGRLQVGPLTGILQHNPAGGVLQSGPATGILEHNPASGAAAAPLFDGFHSVLAFGEGEGTSGQDLALFEANGTVPAADLSQDQM